MSGDTASFLCKEQTSLKELTMNLSIHKLKLLKFIEHSKSSKQGLNAYLAKLFGNVSSPEKMKKFDLNFCNRLILIISHV